MAENDEKVTPTAEAYLMNEKDLLIGLLRAGKDKSDEWKKIEVARKGEVLFTFRVRPLSEGEYESCRKKATKYEKNSKFGGIRVAIETNAAKMRSLILHTATHPDDKKALWDNPEALKVFGVLSGVDVIDKVLLAGEKDAILDLVDEISGYKSDDGEATTESEQLEEQAGN